MAREYHCDHLREMHPAEKMHLPFGSQEVMGQHVDDF